MWLSACCRPHCRSRCRRGLRQRRPRGSNPVKPTRRTRQQRTRRQRVRRLRSATGASERSHRRHVARRRWCRCRHGDERWVLVCFADFSPYGFYASLYHSVMHIENTVRCTQTVDSFNVHSLANLILRKPVKRRLPKVDIDVCWCASVLTIWPLRCHLLHNTFENGEPKTTGDVVYFVQPNALRAPPPLHHYATKPGFTPSPPQHSVLGGTGGHSSTSVESTVGISVDSLDDPVEVFTEVRYRGSRRGFIYLLSCCFLQ